MAEFLPEAIFEADLGLNITYANRRASELFGFTAEEIQRGVNGLQGITPEDRPRAVALMERRRRGEEPGVVEYTGLRKDGSVSPILISRKLSPLKARGGKLDLVLTDVVLPGMNGKALVEEITGRFPGVRTLFMSGYTDEVITRHGDLEEGIAFLLPLSYRMVHGIRYNDDLVGSPLGRSLARNAGHAHPHDQQGAR